jgi:hypothetical protein
MRHAVIAALATLVVACSILSSFDGIEPRPPAADAGADVAVGVDASAGPDAGCPLERWPGPPSNAGSTNDLGELTSAVSRLRVLDPVLEGKFQGFDLDGLCTCPDRPACVGAKANEPCDIGGTGVDNVGDVLFRTFGTQGAALDDTGLKAGIQEGQFGVLIRISGYNGEPNDSDVRVTVLNAFGVNGDGGTARGDGTDTWTIDEDSLLGRFPAYFSSRAYVTNGTLVADMLRVVLRTRIPTLTRKWILVELDLRDLHLVARIGERKGQGIALEAGRIAGRIPGDAMLAQGMRSGACLDSPIYATLKPVVCASRDLPSDPAKDGRDEPCRSLSFGFGFASVPATAAEKPGTKRDEFPCPILPDTCD